jgi:hypothetical protein
MPAVGAALRVDDPGVAELCEDVLQERQRDPLRRADSLPLERMLAVGAGGKLDRGPDRVVGLRGDPHSGILSDPSPGASRALRRPHRA